MISAKIISDSNSWLEKRLTTFVLEYPRYIHSELLTHRVFSKNSASSRAIPVQKMIDMVVNNTTIPKWTENEKGMQGKVIEDEEVIQKANAVWGNAALSSIGFVNQLNDLKIHKQNANRLLEPFQHIRIILTGTEFDNWFALRDHDAAHPEIHELAKQMRKAYDESLPIYLDEGDWHIPFGDMIEDFKAENPDEEGLYYEIKYRESPGDYYNPDDYQRTSKLYKLKISVARCARISYNTFEGGIDYAKDIALFKQLVGSEPLHASPAEHQARVPTKKELIDGVFNTEWAEDDKGWHEQRGKYVSNLVGWIQFRKVIEQEKYKKEDKLTFLNH